MIARQIVAEGLMSQLAGEVVPTYDSTGKTLTSVIDDLLAFQRNANPITKGTIEPTWEDMSGWISPTGHNEPTGGWNQETKAYDDNTTTSAYTDLVPVTSWSDFLELTHAAFDCNKVRFMADMSGKPAGSLLDVDVFYSGNWHSVYMAQPADDTWVEADISGTVEVTAARARFYNPDAVIQHNFWLKEFDFWGVEGGKLTVTNQSILWALLQLHEIVGSGYIYVDNDRVFHWLDDIGEDKGQQIRYRKNLEGITRETDWGSLCTRLYPIGNGVQLSDLTVFKEALE